LPREAPSPDVSGRAAAASSDLEHLSSQLSALLADMVRAPEVDVPSVLTPDVKPGGTIGRFELTRELGRGGFGVVYEATDRELSRTVALKVVKPGTRIAARGSQWLLQEAEAVARLNHPNIITLHDLGQGPSGPYLVFELLRGKTLHDALRDAPLPLDAVVDTAIAIARALVHAHAAGVVHRDLTAANVFLPSEEHGGGGPEEPGFAWRRGEGAARATRYPTTGRGLGPSNPETGTVKVLDFGLAHLFGRDGANDGGTPAYMAPEQWEGDRGDARTDLFALGVILFQCLTGRYPYKVDKGWSEALEPGRTPRLPRQAGPARLRRLVEALLNREPELRPESAKVVRDELLAVHRARSGAGGRRTVWGFALVAAAAVGLAGWLSLRREPDPGEQVRAVVAAMENGAGDPTLDAVPGLLSVALEPSPRVKVVPPSRLAYASRQAGLGDPGKIDADKGRSLARLAGAEVVLVPSAWRTDGTAVVGVRAVESESGKKLFSVEAPLSGRGGLAGLVDQLSDRVRRELNERADDRKLRRPVAETVTASAEAARWYYEGVDCKRNRTSAKGDALQCVPAFERALSFDPTFPLAHYQLAAVKYLDGDSGDQSRPHVDAALRALDRLPSHEVVLLRALKARIDGGKDRAFRDYELLLASAPDDPEVLALASDVQIERGEWASAARYLEKLVAVAPDQEQPLLTFIEALGRLNDQESLRALLERLRAEPQPRPRAIVEAALWLGKFDLALDTARAAVSRRGDVELSTLAYTLQAVGEYEEMEQVSRKQVEVTRSSFAARRNVEVALTGQGRVAEGLRWATSSQSLLPATAAAAIAYRQAVITAGTADPARVWPYAARAYSLDPAGAADLALVLALLGDMPHAATLARNLEPGSIEGQAYQALRAWRSGDVVAAQAVLASLEARDPWPANGLAPAYLLAEVTAAAEEDSSTLAAVERCLRLPADRLWRTWALPRVLYLSARAHHRLGEDELARQELDRLLRMLKAADHALPVVTQARVLRASLR
jgi:tetratricopeptide (TPR) repeat protein